MRGRVGAMVAVALAVSCGGDDEGPSGTTSAGSGGALPVTTAPIAVSGWVTGLLDLLPVADAEVCDLDGETCTTTDAEGFFTLTLEPDGDVALRTQAEGSVPTVSVVPDPDRDAYVLPALVPEGLLGDATGLPIDPALGLLFVLRTEGGVSASSQAGDGPHYFAGPGPPDPMATSTPPNGAVMFINVEPGVHSFSFTHASATCDLPAWRASDGTGELPFAAGALTLLPLLPCD